MQRLVKNKNIVNIQKRSLSIEPAFAKVPTNLFSPMAFAKISQKQKKISQKQKYSEHAKAVTVNWNCICKGSH